MAEVAKQQPHNITVELVFLFLYWILITMLIIYLNLITLKLNSSNSYGKKIMYLFIFLINYILGKVAFKHVNPLLSTGIPLLTMYFINKWLYGLTIIGVTGGIACGKTTLVKGLKEKLIVRLIDCDEISRKVSLPGQGGYNFILKMLGDKAPEYVDPSTKMIRRDKLGQLTFNDSKIREKLTKGVGKFIFWEIFKQLFIGILEGHRFILIDAPILFQTKILTYICYPIIVVYLDREDQIKRLIARNHFTREEAINRITSQMSLEEKVRRGNICIKNTQTPEKLVESCEAALTKFLSKLQK